MAAIGLGALAVCFALILSGCSAKRYRKQADRDVYRIIQNVEASIFGHTNTFSIDTEYSHRKPSEILPPELIEDRLQTNARLLTVEYALDLAMNNSREFQDQKELLYLEALRLTGERYAFDPHFFAGGDVGLVRDSQKEVSIAGGPRIGVEKLFRSGGSLGLTIANDLLRFYTGSPRRSILSAITFDLAQPLLRGFGRNNPAIEALTQAERDVTYAVRDFAFFQNEFAMQVVTDYFDLLAQKDTIRNRYTNYLSRVRSTERLEARAADRESVMAVDQARQAELSARNSYVDQIARFRNELDQFKILLGLPVGERVNLDDSALVELKAAGLIEVPLDPDEAYRIAVTKQMQILNRIDAFEDSKRKIRVAIDQLRTDLNVGGRVDLDSGGRADYVQFQPDRVRAEVGLSIDLPIDRLRERNTYRRTLVDFEAAIRSLTLRLDQLKDDIDRGLRTLEQRRQNYQIQSNALLLANRRVESALLLLEAGRAEVRDLVEAQDAQINAQNALTTALVEYQRVRLQLMLDIGALNASVDQFWLQDHVEDFLPDGATIATRPPESVGPVLPPEAYFAN